MNDYWKDKPEELHKVAIDVSRTSAINTIANAKLIEAYAEWFAKKLMQHIEDEDGIIFGFLTNHQNTLEEFKKTLLKK